MLKHKLKLPPFLVFKAKEKKDAEKIDSLENKRVLYTDKKIHATVKT